VFRNGKIKRADTDLRRIFCRPVQDQAACHSRISGVSGCILILNASCIGIFIIECADVDGDRGRVDTAGPQYVSPEGNGFADRFFLRGIKRPAGDIGIFRRFVLAISFPLIEKV